MNPLPDENDWDAFNNALPTPLSGKAEKKPAELRLSDRQAQPVPFFNIAGQFGAKLVQFAKPGVSKKVLAAMADDPDPAASLANIRKLLVGPTRNLHDAMFEEVVTILEESDREVQQALRALEHKCGSLSHITDELVSSSVESRDQNRKQTELLQKELQRSATSHQEMLSEMFLVIDSKIEELTTQANLKIEALVKRIETDMREAAEIQERNMRELEAKCLASSEKATGLLETRLAHLERKSNSDKDDLSEVFTGGFTSIADRLKALREN